MPRLRVNFYVRKTVPTTTILSVVLNTVARVNFEVGVYVRMHISSIT
jgi:hypothetical protein